MRVIIFGGMGFLGCWLVKKLHQKGIKLKVFDKKINRELYEKINKRSFNNLDYVKGDIRNFKKVLETIRSGDILINLAGLMTPECSKNPTLGNSVNVIGSINLFEAAKFNQNNYIIYMSSAGVYGRKSSYNPFPETHYGAFKLAVEGLARAYYLENKINNFGLRPYVIYGPGREIGGTSGITLACKAVAENNKYIIPFSGSSGLVYVEDVVEIMLFLILKQFKGSNIMNVNGITHSVEDVIKYLNKLQHNSTISNYGNNLPVVSKIRGNGPSKFFSNFKFTKLEKGLKKTVDYYKQIELK